MRRIRRSRRPTARRRSNTTRIKIREMPGRRLPSRRSRKPLRFSATRRKKSSTTSMGTRVCRRRALAAASRTSTTSSPALETSSRVLFLRDSSGEWEEVSVTGPAAAATCGSISRSLLTMFSGARSGRSRSRGGVIAENAAAVELSPERSRRPAFNARGWDGLSPAPDSSGYSGPVRDATALAA